MREKIGIEGAELITQFGTILGKIIIIYSKEYMISGFNINIQTCTFIRYLYIYVRSLLTKIETHHLISYLQYC